MKSASSAPYTVAAGRDHARRHRVVDAAVPASVWSDDVRRFVDYWCGLRNGRRFPARLDIDPLDIVWSLPRMFVGDIDPAGPEYIYRVAGEEIVNVFNRYNGRQGLYGVRLGESLPEDKAALIRDRWRPLAEIGEVIYMRGMIYQTLDSFALGERVVLPTSGGGVVVNGFCGMTVCEWHKPGTLPEDMSLDIYYLDPQTLTGGRHSSPTT